MLSHLSSPLHSVLPFSALLVYNGVYFVSSTRRGRDGCSRTEKWGGNKRRMGRSRWRTRGGVPTEATNTDRIESTPICITVGELWPWSGGGTAQDSWGPGLNVLDPDWRVPSDSIFGVGVSNQCRVDLRTSLRQGFIFLLLLIRSSDLEPHLPSQSVTW
jgi:hypothetical protein